MAEDQSTNANVVLTADVDGYRSSIQGAERDTSQLASSVDTLVTKIGNLTRAAGRGVQIISGTTLVGLAAAAKHAADFESQMSTLKATASTTGPAIEKTAEQVRTLAKTFPVARGEVVALVTQLSNLGVKSSSQIQTLSSTMIKLSGATGESLSGLTQGFVELSRTMGTVSGSQSQRYANSLYSISRSAGVAAGNVLSFANAIAPMARAAGMGQKEVMGIATAFSKAGADGYAGATTFNTMMADITRNIQYGSPEISKYANLIGVTADQFKKMDITEATIRMFEEIGKSGPKAIKILDQMGYDGIRVAKSMTAVSQQAGGLRKAVEESYGTFTGNSLDKGAQAAFGGLNDQFTKMKTNIGDIGISIGNTMLAPLTTVAKVLNDIIGGFASIASKLERVGQLVAPVVAAVAALGTIGLGPLAALGTARMFMRSTTGESLAGGFAAGRNVPVDQMGRGATAGYTAFATNRMSPMQNRFFTFAQGAGRAVGPYTGEGSTLGAVGRAAILAPINTASWFMRSQRDFYENSVRAPYERQSMFGGAAQSSRLFDAARAGYGYGGLTGAAQATSQVLKAMTVQAGGFGAALAGLTRSTLEMAGAAAKASGSLIAIAARSAGGFLGNMLGGVPGMTMMAAFGAFAAYNNMKDKRSEWANAENANMGLQNYNEQLGIATDNLSSFSDALRTAEKQLPKPTTISQAKTVTGAEALAATASGRTLTSPLMGALHTDREAVAFLRSAGTLSPTQIQAYKLDLIDKFGPDRAERILSAAGVGGGTVPAGTRGRDAAALIMNAANRERPSGLSGGFEAITRGMWAPGISQTSKGTIAEALEGITRNYKSYPTLSAGDRQRVIAEVKITMDALNKQLIQSRGVAEKTAAQIKRITGISVDVARSAGGDYDISFNPTDAQRRRLSRQGINISGSYNELMANATRLPQGSTTTTDILAGDLGKLKYMGAAALSARAAIQGNEGNPAVVGRVVEQLAKAGMEAQRMGASVGDVQNELQIVADTAKNSLTPALAGLATAAMSIIASMRDVNRLFMSRGEARQEAYTTGLAQIGSTNYTAKTQGRQILVDQIQSDVAFMQNAYMTALNYGKQKRRYQEDYQHQVTLSEDAWQRSRMRSNRDFERQLSISDREHKISVLQSDQAFARQRGYAESDYYKSRARSIEDFNTSQRYAQEDYNKSIMRANRDYQTSEARGMEDFNKGRLRAQADFDKQMARRAVAAAKSIYDPYRRITTQQTMDTQNLLINLQKQTKAIEDQTKNLETLRNAGISQQTIDVLGLSDAANAQQLARMTNDLQNNPSLIDQLNAAVSSRTTASGALVNNTNSLEYRQTLEDFQTSMQRSQEDFDKTIQRSREDFAKSMSDMAIDFASNTTRANEQFTKSLERGDFDFKQSMQRTLDEYNIAMQQQEEAYLRNLADTKEAYKVATADAKQDHDISMEEMARTHKLTLSRMNQDLVDSFKAASGTIAQMGKDTITMLQNAGVTGMSAIVTEINTMVTRAKSAYDALMKMQTDLYLPGWHPGITPPGSGGGGGFQNPSSSGGPLGTGTKGWDGSWKNYPDGSWHGGADYQAAIGTPVYATKNGTAINVQDLGGSSYGKYIKLSDGKYDYYFAHLSKQTVTEGQTVKEGTLIGYSGNTGNSTGPHLHYEVRPAGAGYKEALDPSNFMALGGIVAGGPRRTVLGEAGPEAVIPLNSKGAAFMASTIKEALTSGYAVPARMHTSSNSNSTSMDYSNNFNGPITVEASDPSELARKLEAKARMQRLVRPGSSR